MRRHRSGSRSHDHLLILRSTECRRTPLHFAVWFRDSRLEIVRLLLEKGANVEALTKADTSALSQACQASTTEVVEALLEAGANAESPSCAGKPWEPGYTPLLRAVLGDKPSNVEKLIQRGVNLNAQTANTRKTALYLAVERQNVTCVSLLCRAGADVNARDHKVSSSRHSFGHLCFCLQTKQGTTPLIRAVSFSQRPSDETICADAFFRAPGIRQVSAHGTRAVVLRR